MVGSPRWSAAATSSPASTWTIARPPTRSWNAFATGTPASCSTVPPLEQNLQLTRDVVRVARPAGVSVEAEVGTIGTTAEYGAEIENPHLADPAACEAMGETGIDALAVAISNAHGVYIAEPKLDFDLLAEIRRRTEVPLVLHGGSAIPVDQVQKAIGGRGQDERRNRNPRSVQGGYGGRLAENPGSHDIMESSAAASPASETSCASTSTSPCPPDALRDSGEPDAR